MMVEQESRLSLPVQAKPQEPRLNWVMCASASGTHRMAYWEWGEPDNDRVLLCVHGLTRTGRDFDLLARHLAPFYRVVAPDVVGRGRSDWLIDPTAYTVPQYVNDMLVLIARLAPARLDWVGTSMGGLIGLGLQAVLQASTRLRPAHPGQVPSTATVPLGKLVLNDVGPSLDLNGVQRIAHYVGEPLILDSYQQAVEYVKSASAGSGPHDEQAWDDLTRHIFVPRQGRWYRHYDIRLAHAFAQQAQHDLEQAQDMLWSAYQSWPEAILVLRGEHSDLLSRQQAAEMCHRRPAVQLQEIAAVGHAPSLRSGDQLELIERFLVKQA